MAPSIVTSQMYTAVSVHQQSCALPSAVGDGYTLIVATNNGVLPLQVTSQTLLWRYATSAVTVLSNGETGVITVFHAPFICFPSSLKNNGSCSGEVATIQLSGTVDSIVTCCLAITGTAVLFPVSLTFDLGVLNGSIYFNANSTTQPAALTFSTNDYNDLSICVNIADTGSLSNNTPLNYASVNSAHIFGSNYLIMSVGQQSFGTAQVNNSWNWGGLSGFGTQGMEFSYTDGAGGGSPSMITALLQPLRRSKLINSVIGR